MANITKKQNGSYLIRIFLGKDANGKPLFYSKTFWPSKPNIPYSKLQKEMEMFINNMEEIILTSTKQTKYLQRFR